MQPHLTTQKEEHLYLLVVAASGAVNVDVDGCGRGRRSMCRMAVSVACAKRSSKSLFAFENFTHHTSCMLATTYISREEGQDMRCVCTLQVLAVVAVVFGDVWRDINICVGGPQWLAVFRHL